MEDSYFFLEHYGSNWTTLPPVITTESKHQPYPVFVGYICAIITAVLYGSNFVPVKKYYTGDGMFFQYVLCNGIFLGGLVLFLIRNSQHEFYPIVMVGGAIWATGNLCVVPIIKTIGMGLGISLWGTIAVVVGWASGKFGWFGTNKDSISHVGLNYGGVVLAVCSILLMTLVRDEVSSARHDPVEKTVAPPGSTEEDLLSRQISTDAQDRNTAGSSMEEKQIENADDKMFIEKLSPTAKKAVGFTLCVLSGWCFGVHFMPAIYVQDNYGPKGASQNGLDYVFTHYCGIYLASSVYFYIYCMTSKNSPKIYPEVILPGILSGILWSIATACCFVANAVLSQSVSFPIVGTVPSTIASLFWGVVVFREIRGKRNILLLVFNLLVITTGGLLTGFSK